MLGLLRQCFAVRLLMILILLRASAAAQTASSHGQKEIADLTIKDHFHIGIMYGTGQVNLEVDGQRPLRQEPSSGIYEDQQPVSGSFNGGSTRFQRTTFSYLFDVGNRTLFAGVGLENLSLGGGGSPLHKSGGTEAEFRLNAMVFELGAIRRLNVFTQARGSIAYDHFLDGKLRSRYLIRTAAQTGGPRYAVVEDHVSGGGRLNLSGSYFLNITPGLSAGLQISAHYGIVEFRERGSSSAIFGYTLGMCLILRI